MVRQRTIAFCFQLSIVGEYCSLTDMLCFQLTIVGEYYQLTNVFCFQLTIVGEYCQLIQRTLCHLHSRRNALP